MIIAIFNGQHLIGDITCIDNTTKKKKKVLTQL